MAKIGMYMNAIGGIAKEQCGGCDRKFKRGERMAGVKDSEGEPMGMFCDECIADWKANGVKSRIFKES